MVRAMQLLLPGSRLRPEFSSAALVEARRRWRGSLEEFQKVVAPRDWAHGDLVFYDGPLKEDIDTRWEGGLHVRLQPPKLELEIFEVSHVNILAPQRGCLPEGHQG